MKTGVALLTGVLALATAAAPTFAQTGTPAQTPAPKAAPAETPKATTPDATKPAAATTGTPAEAAKPADVNAAKPHQLTAEMVSVNAEAKTMTLKRTTGGKAEELTFNTDPAVAAALADIKPGESVRITYLETPGRRTATAIAKVTKK